MDRGRVMGLGRWTAVFGTLAVGAGLFVGVAAVSWAGAGATVLGLATVTAVKFRHYRNLGMPTARWAGVWGAWLSLSTMIAVLLVDYTYARLTPGYEGAFWLLAIAAGGFWAVYWGLRTKWVPASPGPEE